ncbi:hypothetical protein M569_14097 [Genlisea aurea]|uniref:Uncharacterized protein n=1 Tax=Genlisea aurea TaxID=192259 RepID=S8C8I4_9LAMI|nr:hypothetical protein M569_14097 [Genlisea aurea]
MKCNDSCTPPPVDDPGVPFGRREESVSFGSLVIDVVNVVAVDDEEEKEEKEEE